MSTRVNKGTPRFKPVIKTKSRVIETPKSNPNVSDIPSNLPPSEDAINAISSHNENTLLSLQRREALPESSSSTVLSLSQNAQDDEDRQVSGNEVGYTQLQDPPNELIMKLTAVTPSIQETAGDADAIMINNGTSEILTMPAPPLIHQVQRVENITGNSIGITVQYSLFNEGTSTQHNKFLRTVRAGTRACDKSDENYSNNSDRGSATGDRDPYIHKESKKSSSEIRFKNGNVRRGSVFGPLADSEPGNDLDPTLVTMAALCSDTGQGRISSKACQIQQNHIAWKVNNKEKRARLRTLREAKKYGLRDPAEDMDIVASSRNPTLLNTEKERSVDVDCMASISSRPLHDTRQTLDPPHEFDYNETLSTNRYNVRVRIGPNGETVLDEETLYVDRAADPAFASESYTHIEESDQTKFVNSQTYSKKPRGFRWTLEETELFYNALSQFGENYELISLVLPGRDRQSCKNKFKTEDKKNPDRVSHCLKNRIPYDMQTLSRMTGRDFSGPVPEVRAPLPPDMGENSVESACGQKRTCLPEETNEYTLNGSGDIIFNTQAETMTEDNFVNDSTL